MKVLHVIPAVAPRYGGPSRAILEMCRALQERGIDLLIATTDADGPGRLSVEPGRPRAYKGVPTIFFPRQWSEGFKYSNLLARWLDSNVKTFDLLHIHAVFSHSSIAAALACRRYGIPYVLRPLGSLDPWSLNQKRLRKRLLWHFGVKQMLRGAVALHYTTAEERRLAEDSLGLTRGVVVPLAVNEDLFKASAVPPCFRWRFPSLGADPYLLVLCRLHPKKGLELLLEAFLALIEQMEFKRWRLVVAGQGEAGYVTSLQRLAQQGGGNGRILFTGWLEGAEKISALREAALVALPSHQENFGLSVVEALACGVPVLVSSHVNLAEQIQAAGAGWVVSLERAALEHALFEALREGGERARRGAAGRDFARGFSWPRIAADLVRLYGSVAHTKGKGTNGHS